MGKGALDIVLDPASRQVDSYGFANLLENSSRVNFFIGGAYGFEKNFIDKSNKSISLGKITLSHKLVKVVLAEQVFRALSIINGHPYHK
jgi:23S rRNA (pseudouridine1915-N3)-methyltransferase